MRLSSLSRSFSEAKQSPGFFYFSATLNSRLASLICNERPKVKMNPFPDMQDGLFYFSAAMIAD